MSSFHLTMLPQLIPEWTWSHSEVYTCFYFTHQQPLKAYHIENRILLICHWNLLRTTPFISECTLLFLLKTCSALRMSIPPRVQTPRKQGLCLIILNDLPMVVPSIPRCDTWLQICPLDAYNLWEDWRQIQGSYWTLMYMMMMINNILHIFWPCVHINLHLKLRSNSLLAEQL